MHSSLEFTWSGGIQFTVTVAPGDGNCRAKNSTKHTSCGKHGAVRESSWEEHSDQFWI